MSYDNLRIDQGMNGPILGQGNRIAAPSIINTGIHAIDAAGVLLKDGCQEHLAGPAAITHYEGPKAWADSADAPF
jgi:hypothetical protein